MNQDDETQLITDVFELDRETECPCCSEQFDSEMWEDIKGYHFRSGGRSVFGCPTDNCEGTVVLYT